MREIARVERLELRITFCALHLQMPAGMTVEEVNALPADSPLPFDLHHEEMPVSSPPLGTLPPPAPSTTIRNSGATSNRIDIALVGDGYTSAQLGTYATQANSFLTSFFNEAPYDRYASFFNVHRVDVTSTDSGVDNDPSNGILRNTALDMAFWCQGIERLLCVDVTKAYSYAANAPAVDQVIALANSTMYGGAGYPSNELGTYSAGNGSSIEVAKHEFAHAIGDLADEYDYADGTTYTGAERPEANVSIYNSASIVSGNRKWYRWMDLPNVDAFQGAYYKQFGVYRPTNGSKMRVLNAPFEEVNVEQLILKFYSTVRPIDSATAAGTYRTQTATFSVDPVDPVGTPMSVQWYVDGVAVPGATGLTFNPNASGVVGNHTLSVTVKDPTTAVRDETARASLMTETRTWTLDGTAPVVTPSPFNVNASPMQLTISFNESVSASLSASDLVVQNLTTSSTVPSASINLSYNTTTNVATFTFPGYASGILPNGNYTATLPAASVPDAVGNPNTVSSVSFYVLAGDANRDRKVNTLDFNLLAGNFGGTSKNFQQGDFSYNGSVGSEDFNIFVNINNYGRVLAAPSEPLGAAPVAPAPGVFGGVFGAAPVKEDEDVPALI